MNKYKINYIFDKKQDINDILIKVLNKELKRCIQTLSKNKKCEVPSAYTYLSLEEGKNCCDEFK